jgi:hypothetical protein
MPHPSSGSFPRSRRIVALAFAVLAAGASPAFADRIDGDWCDGARSVTIQGPTIRTPGNNTIQGNYGRHDFTYTIPAGEPGAGGAVDLRLMNEENATVTYGSEQAKVWRRCRVTS